MESLNPMTTSRRVEARPRRTVEVVLPWLAAVLIVGGGIAGFSPAAAAAARDCRWIALAIFLPFAIRRRSLLVWTFWAMAAGVELGLDAPHAAAQLRVIGDLFLRLVRMIVAPLILGAIATGIAGHNELKGVGRVAVKSIVFFEVVTTIGLLLGLVAINLTRAGVGLALPSAGAAPAGHAETWQQVVLNIFPENIAQAIAQNQILQVAVFALLFGSALAMLPQEKREPMVRVLQSLTDAMFKMTKIIMYIAPLAAGAAMAYTIGSTGVTMILPLLKLVGTYYGSVAIFVLLVLAPILALTRISPMRFAAAIAEPAAIAFATTSSEAALPLAMERMEEFGVPRWIVSFVVPLGYSFNMTGSSLYLTMAAIFAAQASGIHLTVGEQLVMLATLMLTSNGVAGVPRATLVVLMGSAAQLRIPTAAILVLLGVDTLMDMGRSAMNVVGNGMAAAVVARWDGAMQAPAVNAQ